MTLFATSSDIAVTRLLELAKQDPKYLSDLEKWRRAVVVVFSDICGSTEYFEKHGDAAGLMLVHECNTITRRIVERHGGRVVKTIGDGTMAAYDDSTRAVAAAIEMQCSLADMNTFRNSGEQIVIRVGLHYGSGIVKSNDIFGDVVNTASRVESVAAPGQILISDQLHGQIKSLGFRTTECGRFSLKGKTGEQRLWEVLWQDSESRTKVAADAVPAVPVQGGETSSYKVQVVNEDGSVAAEYGLQGSLTVGRSQGDIQFPSDTRVSAPHARIFLEQGKVYVEDISDSGESVFLRLSTAYTLHNNDLVIMGHEMFRFHEDNAMMSAATSVGATLADITSLNEMVAEFVRLDRTGSPAQHCPLRTEVVSFGRSQGTYTFPEDKLMSRLHARVLQRGEDFLIKDAGSRNGTFIKVRGKALVAPGSSVLVGNHTLRLVEYF